MQSKDAPMYSVAETPFTTDQLHALVAAAVDGSDRAYRPYSNFSVGCAIMTTDGSLFKGCNIETANYDGSHGEEIAVGAMVMGGHRDPVLYMCMGGLKGQPKYVIASCGKCRQVMMEFASLSDREVWCVKNIPDGTSGNSGYTLQKLTELLPGHFGPADVGVDLDEHRRPKT